MLINKKAPSFTLISYIFAKNKTTIIFNRFTP